MNRTKHIHHNEMKAFADGWEIEYLESFDEAWHYTATPKFQPDIEYRIIPDEDGWIPWYGDTLRRPHSGTEVELGGRNDDGAILYRLKQRKKRCRVALFRSLIEEWTRVADTEKEAAEYEHNACFIKWITDWIEYGE